MSDLDDILPAADPTSTVDVPTADGTTVVLGPDAIEIAGERLARDRSLDVTLAWSHPDRTRLLLELRSVRSARERVRVTLACTTDALERHPPTAAWVQAPLPELMAATAPELDAPNMEHLLAGVRATLEVHATEARAGAGRVRWYPPGDLCFAAAYDPAGWTRLDDTHLRSRMLVLEAGVDADLLVEDIGPKPSALGRVRNRVRGDVVVLSAVGLVVIGTFFGGFFGFLATTIVAGLMLAAKFHDDPRVRASREGKRYLAAIAEGDARRTRLRRVVATIASTHAKVDRKRVERAEVERVEAVPRAGVSELYARGKGASTLLGVLDPAIADDVARCIRVAWRLGGHDAS